MNVLNCPTFHHAVTSADTGIGSADIASTTRVTPSVSAGTRSSFFKYGVAAYTGTMVQMPPGTGSGLSCDNPSEKWCDECGRRVTVSPNNPDIEYGHVKYDANNEPCPNRPDEVDISADRRTDAGGTPIEGVPGD